MATASRKPARATAAIVAAAATAFVGLAVANSSGWYDALRERAFDSVLGFVGSAPAIAGATVVDIDRPSLRALGPWPWGRDRLARLVDAIASGKPKALGIDMLIVGADERSPAALARKLDALTGSEVLRNFSGELADGDALLAAAIARTRTVLGVALDPESNGAPPPPSVILVEQGFDASRLWHAGGVIAPDRPISAAAAGLGTLALSGDADGIVRRVPLLAVAGNRPVAGLAVEVMRVAEGANAVIVKDSPRRLAAGSTTVPIEADGMLRLLPSYPAIWQLRTLSAASLLGSAAVAPSLEGRIVLLGSSAPELGGLRTAASGVLTPSVQLQADAIAQLLAGNVPQRPASIVACEYLAAIVGSGLAVAAALYMAPLWSGLIVLLGCAVWIFAAGSAAAAAYLLVDPIFVPASAALCFSAAALAEAGHTLRREALIRRRFEQHLAPEVVRRIIERPELLRLEGEVRVITAMFTDVEDFTAMTERSDPRLLVRVLDRYFDGLVQIAIEHGGMIDKFVGDGVRVLFNAPLDLEAHASHAVGCARAIGQFSAQFRSTAEAQTLGFGRTRIGIETGEAIVGDVGGGRKLDYTAHGNAVNTAARLEAANKQLGSSVCIGPGTAALLPGGALRPLGKIATRGRTEELAVFDLWPDTFDAARRAAYTRAIELAGSEPRQAARLLRAMAADCEGDPVLLSVADRCEAIVTAPLPASP